LTLLSAEGYGSQILRQRRFSLAFSARAAPIAVLTSLRSSGGGRIAFMPSDLIAPANNRPMDNAVKPSEKPPLSRTEKKQDAVLTGKGCNFLRQRLAPHPSRAVFSDSAGAGTQFGLRSRAGTGIAV
jgi:hypothetical protein